MLKDPFYAVSVQRWASDHWVLWNLLLAIVPLLIAVLLFARPRRHKRTAWWWVGVAVFVAFLPNAPYVVTDLIHVRDSLLDSHPGVVFMKFGILVAGGLLAYVACIALLRHWLHESGLPVWPVELTLHALCTVGIALGRIFRLNSWDIVVQPSSVIGAVGVPTAAHTVVLGCIFGMLCGASIAVSLASGIRAGHTPND
jgi:uncharacterized membrane protein